jgi:hypothetical protein
MHFERETCIFYERCIFMKNKKIHCQIEGYQLQGEKSAQK